MSSATDPGRRGAAGFTLIELLVAVVITGILGAVLFELIQGQGRFVSLQSAREEAQQNSRGGLDLMAGELRAVPAGAIDSAGVSGIRFKLPRAWGILCDPVTIVSPGPIGVIFPPAGLPGDFPPSSFANTSWGFAVPGVATREYVGGTLTNVAAASPSCDLLGAQNGVQVRQLDVPSFSGTPSAAVATGGFLYQTVRYDARPASDANLEGVWLRRQNGDGGMQPLAGPLRMATGDGTGGGGLTLTYYCGVQELTPAQLAVPTNLRTIDRIKIRLAMQSRNKAGPGLVQVQTDSVTVHLRNNGGSGVTCPL